MKSLFYLSFVLANLLVVSCAQIPPHSSVNTVPPEDELLNFAKVNCFFWYFKKMKYELEDIRAISGGIVELGSYSPQKYQNVVFLVKEYKPILATKNNIDIDLLKCFKLESDEGFLNSLEKLK
ncbi:MAG: hypothetical protein COB33_015210 [Thiotrichaceae bacterium]|nr:hypothetical protein [Thiotrichaceae bacterium]